MSTTFQVVPLRSRNVTRCYISIAIARGRSTAHVERVFEERAKAVAAVAAGRSYRAVARAVGVAPVTIMRWWREDKAPDDPVAVAAALAFLEEGWSVRDVAEAAGVPRASVRRWKRETATPQCARRDPERAAEACVSR